MCRCRKRQKEFFFSFFFKEYPPAVACLLLPVSHTLSAAFQEFPGDSITASQLRACGPLFILCLSDSGPQSLLHLVAWPPAFVLFFNLMPVTSMIDFLFAALCRRWRRSGDGGGKQPLPLHPPSPPHFPDPSPSPLSGSPGLGPHQRLMM